MVRLQKKERIQAGSITAVFGCVFYRRDSQIHKRNWVIGHKGCTCSKNRLRRSLFVQCSLYPSSHTQRATRTRKRAPELVTGDSTMLTTCAEEHIPLPTRPPPFLTALPAVKAKAGTIHLYNDRDTICSRYPSREAARKFLCNHPFSRIVKLDETVRFYTTTHDSYTTQSEVDQPLHERKV